jgi:hypothetical protein
MKPQRALRIALKKLHTERLVFNIDSLCSHGERDKENQESF